MNHSPAMQHRQVGLRKSVECTSYRPTDDIRLDRKPFCVVPVGRASARFTRPCHGRSRAAKVFQLWSNFEGFPERQQAPARCGDTEIPVTEAGTLVGREG
eukprot:1037036-Pyramimonas_sp.AAC.2